MKKVILILMALVLFMGLTSIAMAEGTTAVKKIAPTKFRVNVVVDGIDITPYSFDKGITGGKLFNWLRTARYICGYDVRDDNILHISASDDGMITIVNSKNGAAMQYSWDKSAVPGMSDHFDPAVFEKHLKLVGVFKSKKSYEKITKDTMKGSEFSKKDDMSMVESMKHSVGFGPRYAFADNTGLPTICSTLKK